MLREGLWFAGGILLGFVLAPGSASDAPTQPTPLSRRAPSDDDPQDPSTVAREARVGGGPVLAGAADEPAQETQRGTPASTSPDPGEVSDLVAGDVVWRRREPSNDDPVLQLLRACRQAQHGPTPSADDVRLWLTSRDPTERRRGIGWALQIEPPAIEELVSLVHDGTSGAYAGAALLKLAMHAGGRAALLPYLDDLVQARDPDVQRSAWRAVPSFGAQGAMRAVEAARRGDLSASVYTAILPHFDPDSALALTRAVLRAPTSSAALLLRALPNAVAAAKSHPGTLPLVRHLAESHTDPWVREAAERAATAMDGGLAGALVLRSATYGARGKTVDVLDALRARMKDGRLSVQASNDLAGDPLVGVVKDLIVEYEHGGRRRVRVAREGQRLSLP